MQRLAITSILAILVSSGCTVYKSDGPEPDAGNDKVFVCHDGTRTLHIDDNAVRAHLNHGDKLGRC